MIIRGNLDQHLDESEYVERYLQDYSAHKQHKESEHEQHQHRASRIIRSTSNAIYKIFQTTTRQEKKK